MGKYLVVSFVSVYSVAHADVAGASCAKSTPPAEISMCSDLGTLV